MVECLPATQETWVWFLGWEDPLKKGMATDSCILAWRIPWTEKSVGLKSMGSQKVVEDWVTNTSFLLVWTVHCDLQLLQSLSCMGPRSVWGKSRACKRTVRSLLFSSRSSLGLSWSCRCTISCPEHPGLVEGGGAAPKVSSLAGSCLHGLGGETPLFKHDLW